MKRKELVSPAARPRGGIRVPHYKNTAEKESVFMPTPQKVCILMQQHIGAPCLPLIKKGDEVFVGQKIGESENPFSVPIHASVSGTVLEIAHMMLPSGQMTDAVVIESDGEQIALETLKPPNITSKDELISAVRESGLVGLGGAGFPVHIKLGAKQPLDTLVINAAECEPFITADYREMMEHSNNLMDGIYLLLAFMGFEKVIIVVEDNKPAAIELLSKIASDEQDSENRVVVMPVKSVYPRGAEKVTVQIATGRKIPPGKLPADVGCLVMNITSVAFIGRYAKKGMPLVTKRLTVDGTAVEEPKNVIVPVGAYIEDVLSFCGINTEETRKIVMGGPMMGVSLPNSDISVLKQNNAILAFFDKDFKAKPISSCIRCGRCVAVCPMSLMPTRIEGHLKIRNQEALARDNVNVCIECGCCAYSCPAGRPLVQVMKQAKQALKK